jgi:hypothetical protein
VAVGGGQRVGDAGRERHDLLDVELAPAQAPAEVLALEPLHRQERRAVVGHAVADVADDRGVAQLDQREHLAAEALELGARGRAALQDLERDRDLGVVSVARYTTPIPPLPAVVSMA